MSERSLGPKNISSTRAMLTSVKGLVLQRYFPAESIRVPNRCEYRMSVHNIVKLDSCAAYWIPMCLLVRSRKKYT